MFLYLSASGEDPQCSSQKSRKGGGDLGPYSHPPLTPSNASPGTQHGHDDYELCSPSWPRTPASSPVSLLLYMYMLDFLKIEILCLMLIFLKKKNHIINDVFFSL